MPKPEPPRIAVLGAGPIGLEAALTACSLKLPVTIFERGEIGEHLSRWGHVRLFTPFSMNHTSLGAETIRREHPQHELPSPNAILTGHEFRDAYLMPLGLTSVLCDRIRMKTEVLAIGRAGILRTDPLSDPRRVNAPFRLLLRDDKGKEETAEADIVLDCTGCYSRHPWLGDGGIPALGERAAAAHIAYGLEDILGRKKDHYAGRSTIVIGGGFSAATAVCDLATLAQDHSATWVIWLMRGARSTPLPRNPGDLLRERDRLAARANSLATRGDGNVEHHAQTIIEGVESHGPNQGFRVTARCAGKPMSWEVERVIANIGYNPDLALAAELHVGDLQAGQVRQPEPGYYVLGAKSAGRGGSFLLRDGFEQIHQVFSHIAGRRAA